MGQATVSVVDRIGWQVTHWLSPRAFHACGDGATDDTDALRRAVAFLLQNGEYGLVLDGRFRLSETLDIVCQTGGTAPAIIGMGVGSSQSALEWVGSGGVPILRLVNCIGGVLEKFSILRSPESSGVPSSAISLYKTTEGTSSHNTIRNMHIGTQGAGPIAENGICVESVDGHDNSEHAFDELLIGNCSSAGIRFAHLQAVNTKISQTVIAQCGVGIWTPCCVYGFNLGFANNQVDVYFPFEDDLGTSAGGKLYINGMWSEGSARLCEMAGYGYLDVRNGTWQLGAKTHSDGKVIVATGVKNLSRSAVLDDFGWGVSGEPPAVRSIDLSYAGNAMAVLRAVRTHGWSNLNGGVLGVEMPTDDFCQWSVELDYPRSDGRTGERWDRITHYQSSPPGVGSYGLDPTRRDLSWSRPGAEFSLSTTDAAPAEIGVPRRFARDESCLVIAKLLASSSADSAAWTFSSVVRSDADCLCSWHDVVTTYAHKTDGASAWGASFAVSPSGAAVIAVNGAPGATVHWRVVIEMLTISGEGA